MKQMKLNLYQGSRGGRRPGSGRKRLRSPGVAHGRREKVTMRTPLHINFKYRTFIRNKICLKLLKRSIKNSRAHGLKIIHYSLQSNHVHLIVESTNNYILTKGMRSLTITFAKGLKKGRIQIERYHLHVLKTIREAKHALHYVLFNQQKHENGTYAKIDEYSSILFLESGLELVRKYAFLKKMMIKIDRRGEWQRDKEQSFLLRKGLSVLLT